MSYRWTLIVTGGLGEIYEDAQPIAGTLSPDCKLLSRICDVHNSGVNLLEWEVDNAQLAAENAVIRLVGHVDGGRS